MARNWPVSVVGIPRRELSPQQDVPRRRPKQQRLATYPSQPSAHLGGHDADLVPGNHLGSRRIRRPSGHGRQRLRVFAQEQGVLDHVELEGLRSFRSDTYARAFVLAPSPLKPTLVAQ
jgi:hypothetical protein